MILSQKIEGGGEALEDRTWPVARR